MHEALGILWYILLVVLWVGFFVLESFTSGVGMIHHQAKTYREGRLLQYTVAPYWDGTQVWFITAAGATFAAFPLVYAEIFSSLYIAIFLLLFMIIIRGVSMEIIYLDDNPKWQKAMSLAWVVSSYGLALLLGVRFSNLFLDANTLPYSTNDFFALLNKVGILGGLLFIGTFRTNGILWANLKGKSGVIDRALKQVMASAIVTALCMPLIMMSYNWDSNLFATNFQSVPLLWILPIVGMGLPVATIVLILKKQYTLALVTNSLVLVMFMVIGNVGVYPYMVEGVVLTEGMASELTLKIMTGVSVVFVPLVLAYQGWKFYRFRHKLEETHFSMQSKN